MKETFQKVKTYLKKRNKFILQDPMSFEEKFALSLSKQNTIILSAALMLIFSFLVYLVISYTGIKKYIPGYPRVGSELYESYKSNQKDLNRLQAQNSNQSLWIDNLQNILNGEDSVLLSDIKDSLIKDSNFDYKKVVFERSKEDSILRKKVENYNLTNRNSIVRSILTSVLEFEQPHEGKIKSITNGSGKSASYQAKYNSKVKSAMEGVVISKSKNSLVMQHKNNIVSVYSNFSGIKPKLGDKLEGGKKIGVVKDSVFNFQLWYNGKSVPAEAFESL